MLSAHSPHERRQLSLTHTSNAHGPPRAVRMSSGIGVRFAYTSPTSPSHVPKSAHGAAACGGALSVSLHGG